VANYANWRTAASTLGILILASTIGITLAYPSYWAVSREPDKPAQKISVPASEFVAQSQPSPLGVTIIVHYYDARDSTDPLATETFDGVHLVRGTFTIEFGSQPAAAWDSDRYDDLADALTQHGNQLYATVSFAEQPEARRRYRVTPTSRDFCNC